MSEEIREEEEIIEEEAVVEEEEEAPEEEAPADDTDPYLAKALAVGYNPNYAGDNAKSPEEFIKSAEHHNGMMRERLDKALQKLDNQGAILNNYENTNKFLLMQLESNIEAAKGRVKEAEEDDDLDAYKVHQQNVNALEGQKAVMQPSATTSNKAELDQHFQQWVANSEWYGKDGFSDVSAEMDRFATDTWKGSPPQNIQEAQTMLEKLDVVARQTFPDKFYGKTSRRSKASAPVARGGSKSTAAPKTTGLPVSDLNAGDQAVLVMMEKSWTRQKVSDDERKEKRNVFLRTAKLMYGQ